MIKNNDFFNSTLEVIFTLLCICIGFLMGIYSVNASGVEATGIEYNISSTGVVAPKRQVQGRYGFTTYSGMYCNQGTCTWPVQSIYGNAGTNSGKYFTYFMYASNEIVNVSANIQLVNGDYISCQVDGTTNTGYVYNATCDLSFFEINVAIYKYGFTFYQPNTLAYTLDYEISNLYFFNTNAENQQQINNINNNVSNINSSITDSSIDTDNTNSSVDGFSSSTNSSMSNTPVSSMISLPITFLTGVNNALSNSCTNVNYIELFGYQLVLPCLNLSERLGSVWTIIDTIFSCMLIFSIGKSLVSTFARLSDMDTNIMYECYANGTKHRGESFDD